MKAESALAARRMTPILLALVISSLAAVASASVKEDALTLDVIMTRVKAWGEDKSWRKKTFKDQELEKSLKAILSQLGKTVGHEKLQSPVRLSGQKAVNDPTRGFCVLKGEQQLHDAQQALILADGDLKLAFANDCLILATGRIEVSQCSRSILISGDEVEVGIFNSSPQRSKVPMGVVIANLRAELRIGQDLVVAAGESAKVGTGKGIRFVNTPTINIAIKEDCEEHEEKLLDLVWKN